VQPLHLRTQPPVYAQYLLDDYCAYGEAVEDVAEDLPQLYGVSMLALILEAVYPVDPCRFVIAPQYEEILGIHDLIAYQETHGLEGLLALVNIIPQEEVVAYETGGNPPYLNSRRRSMTARGC
jgi:hypothetical protein